MLMFGKSLFWLCKCPYGSALPSEWIRSVSSTHFLPFCFLVWVCSLIPAWWLIFICPRVFRVVPPPLLQLCGFCLVLIPVRWKHLGGCGHVLPLAFRLLSQLSFILEFFRHFPDYPSTSFNRVHLSGGTTQLELCPHLALSGPQSYWEMKWKSPYNRRELSQHDGFHTDEEFGFSSPSDVFNFFTPLAFIAKTASLRCTPKGSLARSSVGLW